MLITLWTVRVACVLYVSAAAAWLTRRIRAATLLSTVGLLFYLAHVAAAFTSQHHWSHQLAYEETARQTAQLFKVRWGGGLYFNYAFTAIWTADVLWMWWNPASYRMRRMSITVATHAFLAFMFFNATVVFGSGWVRWLGLGGCALLVTLWARNR